MESLDLSKRWYSYSLPIKLDEHFAQFAAKSASLAYSIAPGFLRIDPEATTAYIDAEGITFLPQKYFSAEFYNKLGIDEVDHPAAAITIINGSTIHEALHRRWTAPFLVLVKSIDVYLSDGKFRNPKTPEYEWITNKYTAEQQSNAVYKWNSEMEYFEGDEKLYQGSSLAKAIMVLDETTVFCIQVVEDLYNENRARDEFSGLAGFMDAKNSLLFVKRFFELKAEIEEELKLETLCNLLVTYKCIDIREDEIWSNEFMRPIIEIFEETKNTSLTNLDRTKLAVKLSHFLQNNEQIDQSDGAGQGQSKLIDGQSQIEGGPTPEGGSESETEGEELAKIFNQMIREGEIKAMKLDDDSTILPEHKFELDQIKPVELVDVMKAVRSSRRTLVYNSKFLKFSQILRYSLEAKHVNGQVREHGPTISKKYLNRIGFDSRVFTRKDVIGRDKGKPEVILLCDSSGSMTYKEIRDDGGKEESLMHGALRAAYGAHISMNKSAIPNAVYSHTTAGSRNGDAPMVYAIAANDMPFLAASNNRTTTTRSNEIRFSFAGSVDSNNNCDGFAIRETAKHFSSRESDKILIILSDGQPSASHYGGDAAVEHTKMIVQVLRRNGIKVYSMSLIREVVTINDFIYGQEFNMRAFGNNMTKNMEECLRRTILM